MLTYPEPRTIRTGGWCCLCMTPDVPTTTGGHGGNVCRKCTVDAADIALFEAADVVAFADVDTDKPLVEFAPNPDMFSRVAGFAQIFDGRNKAVLYRVQESAPDIDACRSFDLIKLRDDAGDKEARRYRCEVTVGGLPVSCECRGYLAHGKCKHTRSIGRLVYERVL
jgi:hypothetical protein